MSKTLKILLILVLILSFTFAFYYVQATSDEDDSTNIVNENSTSSSSLSNLGASSITKVSPVNSYAEANLSLNNILSIILISIGVLLILFSIAILIRLKN